MEQTELPKFYFTFQVKLLRFLGIEVLNKNESIIYRIYSYCTLLVTATFVFSECAELAFQRDFNGIVIVFNYVISHFLGIVKIAVFYTNRKKIGNLMVSLHEGVFKPDENRGGIFEKQCIKKILRQTAIQAVCYGLSIAIVITLGMISSIHDRLTQPQEVWKLPFVPLSLVKHTTYSPRFEMALIFQAVGVVMISLCVYTSDVTVGSIIAQAGAQVKIFERSVRNYEERALKGRSGNKHLKNRLLDDALYKTVEHHLTIIDIVETVERVCSYLVLCVFVGNLIVLTFLMYYTNLMPIRSFEFFQYLHYCVLIAIQLFLYCWWGNELTLANEALALAAAETYNPDGPIHRAKALKLMIIRAQRPLFVTAGKFVPLSLDTYKSIIRGSFSYFMVLRQVNRK